MRLLLLLLLILLLAGCEVKRLFIEREQARTELIRQKSRVYEMIADRRCPCDLERSILFSLDDDADRVFRAIAGAVDLPFFPIKRHR